MTADSPSVRTSTREGGRLPSASGRYQSLDLWRGIACLIVVINHATLSLCSEVGLPPAVVVRDRVLAHESSITPGAIHRIPKMLVELTKKMFFGVEMFFVISGYCITASAESLRRSGRTMREYFRRRFVRIYPPFWCAVMFSAVFCFVTNQIYPGLISQAPWPLNVPRDLSTAQWIGCLTLSGTWIGYVTGEAKILFPLQSWTLCYEEQFYAVVGLLFVISGSRFYRAVAALSAAIVALDVAALVFRFPIHGFFCDEHWFMFAAGVGVYWTLNSATARRAKVFQGFLIAASIGLTVLALKTSLFGRESHISAWRVIGAFGFALILIFLKRYDERIADFGGLGWLKGCGMMSYSIYLVHLFPGKVISQLMRVNGHRDDLSILLICVPLALATAVSLGYVFYRLVELRFLPARHDPIPQSAKRSFPDQGNQAKSQTELPKWALSFERARWTHLELKAEMRQIQESNRREVA